MDNILIEGYILQVRDSVCGETLHICLDIYLYWSYEENRYFVEDCNIKRINYEFMRNDNILAWLKPDDELMQLIDEQVNCFLCDDASKIGDLVHDFDRPSFYDYIYNDT